MPQPPYLHNRAHERERHKRDGYIAGLIVVRETTAKYSDRTRLLQALHTHLQHPPTYQPSKVNKDGARPKAYDDGYYQAIREEINRLKAI